MRTINPHLACAKETFPWQTTGLSVPLFFVIKAIFQSAALSKLPFSNIHPINNTLDEIDLCTWTYTAGL
ncbi:hypothetical protein SAMN04488023_15020 [Pedobacter rhizosphaerae]|uniref:Uncharacterized protein n=1 Tax=Pedobacter rhizosphaerae TaxID=390241 RepID=A0A1H9VVH0_9SPHI|nr:hypothetical protein SAMN04488023_15020 [Pedobacter rhizosphaerae]